MKVTETTNNYKLSLDRRLQKAGKENELSQNKQKQRVKENQRVMIIEQKLQKGIVAIVCS